VKKTLQVRKIVLAGLASIALPMIALPAMAQLPAASTSTVAESAGSAAQQKAANLIGEAFGVASRNREASIAVHDSAALLPFLAGKQRRALTQSWIRLAGSSTLSRQQRLNGYSSFFDVAARHDSAFANSVALQVPDDAARAGAFVDLSQATTNTDWYQANQYAELARRAARQEPDLALRAKALTFIAYHEASLNPATRRDAVTEASSTVRQIHDPARRDALLADLVGAAAKFDLTLANKIAGDISDPQSKKLAQARINLEQISQTTVQKKDIDRMTDLAKAAAPYDMRAVPYLLQVPSSPEIFQILGDSLPPIYPGAKPAIDPSLLQQMWDYAKGAPQDVYRDQLQSRLARLMVLFDLWRGKEWGDQLAWDGGKRQVAQFVQQVVAARQMQLQSEPLRVLAQKDSSAAIAKARNMAPRDRVAALLLIAGQILSPEVNATPAKG
jgi:hypothetical protein